MARGGVVIAEVFAAIEREDERSEQSLPNARLISAAPELLAALRKFVDGKFTYYAGKVIGTDARLTQDDVNRAREAIEKAIKS